MSPGAALLLLLGLDETIGGSERALTEPLPLDPDEGCSLCEDLRKREGLFGRIVEEADEAELLNKSSVDLAVVEVSLL
jgi:hypothetical protein